ncbi:MAG: DUF503 domain-containing protein [Acidobacteriota bacterium]|nr:DUF503 domain-containing protein [Acidobacteriota bacterium]
MVVGFAIAEVHIPRARSLKEKRKVVKSLVDRIWSRHRVSISETDCHDLHQRARIGVALVTSDRGRAEKLLEKVRSVFDSDPTEAVLSYWEPDFVESLE